MQTGDLVSSFGGGGPMWYVDDNWSCILVLQIITFKTYVEACITGMIVAG